MPHNNKETQRKYWKEYYQEHKADIKRRAVEWGRSKKGRQYYRDYYQKNKASAIITRRQYNERIKKEVLAHYGNGKCACVRCGESRLACLSIDHIGSGGTAHRKREHISAGNNFYHWLRRQGFPKGYQVLCMNCQYVKRVENNENNRQLSASL